MHIPIGIVWRRRLGLLALSVLFVVCWSSGFVGAKLGAGQAAVSTLLMWRFVLVAATLVPVAVVLRRRDRSASPRPATWDSAAVARHVLVGALSQVGYLVTVYWAIDLGVSTGTTALIDGAQPLVVATLVGPLLGTAVTGRQWAGLAVGAAGVVLVTWADATSPATDTPAWAYAVPLLGMLSLVASTILERRTRVDVPRREVLTLHCATSAVVFTAVALATGTALPPATGSFWLAMSWLTVLATFGGYGLYWVLVDRIGVAPVNSLMFLIAPVTSVWGALMFREPFTSVTAIGLGLAVLAALTVTRGGAAGADAHRRPATRLLGCRPAPARSQSTT
jgi:drug/metabolite transporter (DMT)-like permease